MLREILKGLLGIGLICTSWFTVLAQNRITYVPPNQEQEKPSTNSSSATRGCQKNLNNVVTLIVPDDHIGLTTLENPILFYHVERKVDNQALLTVSEIKGRSALIESNINLSEQGIKRFQIPQKTPLKLNQKYLWTITIICNPQRPSNSIQVQTILERVPLSQRLSIQRHQTKSYRQRSELSALSGLWYDTLFYLSLTPSHQSDFQDLMQQINLSQINKN